MLTFITHMWSSVVSINVPMLCMGQSQLLANSQVYISISDTLASGIYERTHKDYLQGFHRDNYKITVKLKFLTNLTYLANINVQNRHIIIDKIKLVISNEYIHVFLVQLYKHSFYFV